MHVVHVGNGVVEAMMVSVFLLTAVFLLLLNAFFVLAEFSAVKIRSTQIDAMEAGGIRRAKALRHIHDHLDEYLSVCQVGITLTSIGLGFVGEPAFAGMLIPFLGDTATAHSIAITISYIVVSALHILIGELVPKSIAIRKTEHSALLIAAPIRFFRILFYPPLKVLNASANLILRLMGMPGAAKDEAHTETEVRIILEQSQQQGLMPFRRLLLLENVFDFGDVRVKDVMRPMSVAKALYADHPWEETRNTILATSFSRYPLFEGTPPAPIGIVHLKDLLYKDTPWPDPVDLKAIARKVHTTSSETLLENLLTDLRRRRAQMALVKDPAQNIVGLITMEDIVEQLVGAIEDEFEKDVPVRVGDGLTESRIVLDLQADSPVDAIKEIIQRSTTSDLTLSKQQITDAVLARERTLPTYLGEGLAVPHARLDGLAGPLVFFARSAKGVRYANPEERATIFFLILTPAANPRMQVRLLARLAALRESDYVWDRLTSVKSAQEAAEAIRSGDELLTI